MAKTRRASRSRKASRKASRKQRGGKRAASSWNKAVKKVFEEMRRKDRNAHHIHRARLNHCHSHAD
jgi:hypothetical protein